MIVNSTNLVLVECILIVQGFADSTASAFEVGDHTLHEQQSLSVAKLLDMVGAKMYRMIFSQDFIGERSAGK